MCYASIKHVHINHISENHSYVKGIYLSGGGGGGVSLADR